MNAYHHILNPEQIWTNINKYKQISKNINPPTPSGRRRVRVKSVYPLPEVFARGMAQGGQSRPGKSGGGGPRGVPGGPGNRF